MSDLSNGSLTEEEVNRLVKGVHPNPFALLGPHALPGRSDRVVRVFRPGARFVSLICRINCEPISSMKKIHEDGLFEALVSTSEAGDYKLCIDYGGEQVIQEDVYRFPSMVSSEDVYLFHEGRHERAYEFLGAQTANRTPCTSARVR